MLKRLKLNDENTITYSIKKHHGARKVRISVFGDDSVLVTIPKHRSFSVGELFAEQKKDWIASSLAKNSEAKGLYKIHSGVDIDKVQPIDIKDEAVSLIKERLWILNRYYGFAYGYIKIKRMKSRWGTCSRKGDLTFNYKIHFLPENLRDYVIVHELCHVQAFDHSSNFWNLVARVFPNHRDIRKELNKFL